MKPYYPCGCPLTINAEQGASRHQIFNYTWALHKLLGHKGYVI